MREARIIAVLLVLGVIGLVFGYLMDNVGIIKGSVAVVGFVFFRWMIKVILERLRRPK